MSKKTLCDITIPKQTRKSVYIRLHFDASFEILDRNRLLLIFLLRLARNEPNRDQNLNNWFCFFYKKTKTHLFLKSQNSPAFHKLYIEKLGAIYITQFSDRKDCKQLKSMASGKLNCDLYLGKDP